MNMIGIVYHPKIPKSDEVAEEVCQWVRAREIEAWACSMFEVEMIFEHIANLSLLIVLGGDGSTLRAAQMMLSYDVPILGINMGRIGFLSEADPEDWQDKLAKLLQGDYWIEKRLMIEATLLRHETKIDSFAALNEVVIGRGQQARVLHLHLFVDGDFVTTYTADALIVATPTGSTAYSMAAGGPLLPPQLQNFVVVPVAAHLSLDRALVLHEEAEIMIEIEMDHEATLTADGQAGVALASGDHIVVRKHRFTAWFARIDSSGFFYRRLMHRFGYVPQK